MDTYTQRLINNMSISNLLVATKALSTRCIHNVVNVGFEDGSGWKFYAQAFDYKNSQKYNIYFEVINGKLAKYIETKQN
jgi:hypothetical protein